MREAHVFVVESLLDCLPHEMMHAFGFGGHPLDRRVASALAPGDRRAPDFTAWDGLAFRLLYDRAMVPGLDGAAARLLAARLLGVAGSP